VLAMPIADRFFRHVEKKPAGAVISSRKYIQNKIAELALPAAVQEGELRGPERAN
jgi:hypothetical protein